MVEGLGSVIGTIIGSVLGFLASILPEVFAMISSWLKRRQIQVANQQKIDAAKTGKLGDGEVIRLDDIVSRDDVTLPTPASVPSDEEGTQPGWAMKILNFLRASVRPVITYAFFGIFAFIKLFSMYHAFYVDHTPAAQLLPILWNEGTESLFAAVLAFWFGSRAMAKSRLSKTPLSGSGDGTQANTK